LIIFGEWGVQKRPVLFLLIKHETKLKLEDINWVKHSGHLYSVKNQNGFNNALYNFYQYQDKKDIRRAVQNYPDYYPADIIIIDQMFECNRIYIEHINLIDCQKSRPF
jgi:hypothetical protein